MPPPPIPRVSSQSFKQCSYVIIMCRVGIGIKKLIIKNKNKHPHQSIMHSIHIQKKDTWMKISTWWGQCTFLVFLGYILGFAFTFYLMGGGEEEEEEYSILGGASGVNLERIFFYFYFFVFFFFFFICLMSFVFH